MKKMEYILAHDLGTSGNKATLFSSDGELVGSKTHAYPTFSEQQLWAEQDADDWWRAVCLSTKELLLEAGVLGEDVRAVSFSGQMMGCLPVDQKGTPLRKSIIWADQRAIEQTRMLSEKIDERRFFALNGHRNRPSYGLQKAMWIRDNEPEIYEQTAKFLNAKDYIVCKLTGKFYTDCSDANSMTCFDQEKRDWSEEIVSLAGISMDKLPQVAESVFCVGTVTKEAASLTGLSEKTKVIMGAGDGVAANVGAGCVSPGSAYCCLGTSAWVASVSARPILDEQMRIVCWAHAVPGMYSPNATMQYAGGSYQWMKDTLCREEILKEREEGIPAYEQMDAEISSCSPGADGVLFLPYLMGERAPRWDENAKGVFFGLTDKTGKNQILRSVMEGVMLNLGVCYDILTREEKPSEMTLIGGVARSRAWQQCAADMFDVPVIIPKLLEESNSLGAAVIAGVGSGMYANFSAVHKFLKEERRIDPNPETARLYRHKREEFNRLYAALKPVFHSAGEMGTGV